MQTYCVGFIQYKNGFPYKNYYVGIDSHHYFFLLDKIDLKNIFTVQAESTEAAKKLIREDYLDNIRMDIMSDGFCRNVPYQEPVIMEIEIKEKISL